MDNDRAEKAMAYGHIVEDAKLEAQVAMIDTETEIREAKRQGN